MVFQKNIGLNWECFQCIEILQVINRTHLLLQLCFKGALQGLALWAFAGSVDDVGAEHPFKHWWCLKSSWVLGRACGTGALPAEKLLLQHLSAAQDGSDGQHDIFSLQCPSRGEVNILHRCLFKKDAVPVRPMGNQTQRAGIFSVWWDTVNWAWLKQLCFACLSLFSVFSYCISYLMKPFESFNKCYTSIQKYGTCC